MENLPRRLERVLDDVEMDTAKINREAEKAHAGVAEVFPRAAELAAAKATRDELAAELAADNTPQSGPTPDRSRLGHPTAVSDTPDRPAIAPPTPHPPPSVIAGDTSRSVPTAGPAR